MKLRICKLDIQQDIKLIDTWIDDCQLLVRLDCCSWNGAIFLQILPIYGGRFEDSRQKNFSVTFCYKLLHAGKDFCSKLN